MRWVKPGLGYSHTIVRTDEFPISLTISSNLTRAFVLHPIVAVVALFALLPTIYLRTAFKGYTVVLSTVSMVMVLATLAVDIAFVSINSAKFDANPSLYVWVYFSLGFWPMIVPTLFSIIACVVISVQYWKGRHVKAVDFAEADYPMSPTAAANEEPGFDNGPWWRRFKWAGASTASVNRSQATSVTVIGEQPTDRSV
ncbi:hypothetical protein BC629DRAFT_1155154 [Irpex lacteus]|nr:hypothetical protein BC629DRAFT_1155154 [Irpex lacteus]